MVDQIRADEWLVLKGHAPTRSQAKDLIRQKRVLFKGEPLTKAGVRLSPDAAVEVLDTHLYVGRGARKMLAALEAFDLDVSGTVAVDLGASTGGFTQVLLERGCRKVYAVDVGHDQLAPVLKKDPRVINMEGVNARNPLEISEECALAVVDLSFISLRLVWETVKEVIGQDGDAVVLVKPQFEAGRGGVNRRGVVPLEAAKRLVGELLAWGADQGLHAWQILPSPVIGKKGNQEYLVHLRAQPSPVPLHRVMASLEAKKRATRR